MRKRKGNNSKCNIYERKYKFLERLYFVILVCSALLGYCFKPQISTLHIYAVSLLLLIVSSFCVFYFRKSPDCKKRTVDFMDPAMEHPYLELATAVFIHIISVAALFRLFGYAGA